MKATVLYISKSGKSALISVKKVFGPITTDISGFVGVPEGTILEVEQVIDIPATKVSKEIRTTEDGQDFSYLTFE